MKHLDEPLDKMKRIATEIIKEDNVAVEVKIKSGKDEICIKGKPEDAVDLSRNA
jgi:hypothetical protein